MLAIALTVTPTPSVTAHAPVPVPVLALGGISLGASIVDDVKKLGMPDVVQTRDDGQFWQWLDRDGLDREVLTDDELIVKSVVVARASATSTSQPPEMPVLGMEPSKAAGAIAALGGVPSSFANVWGLGGGYVVTDTVQSSVVRVRAMDVMTARSSGYAGDPLVLPEHKAPVLEKDIIPYFLPASSGTAIILVDVDAAGRVSDARVVVSSGYGNVDEFAIDEMRGSKFRAASCAGSPCAGVFLNIGGLTR
jgi:TonB family protein